MLVPPTSPTKGKQKADIPRPHQPLITKFFQSASSQDLSSAQPGVSQPVQAYILHLIDNKTRNNPTVPPPRDRFQSQLQLMLYKRLLSSLIASTTFASIVTQLSLKTHAPFSQQFLHAKKILCISNDLSKRAHKADCVADLANAWNEAVGELDIGFHAGIEAGLDVEGSGIEDELELVYRERPDPSRSQSLNNYKGKRKGSPSPVDTPRDGKRSATPHSNTGSFTLEVDAALLNVDLGVGSPGPHLAVQYETVNSALTINGVENDDENMALAWAIQESLQPPSTAGTHDKINGERDPCKTRLRSSLSCFRR
jgi:Exonuclease V - a 5' deoxyribonuclease